MIRALAPAAAGVLGVLAALGFWHAATRLSDFALGFMAGVLVMFAVVALGAVLGRMFEAADG